MCAVSDWLCAAVSQKLEAHATGLPRPFPFAYFPALDFVTSASWGACRRSDCLTRCFSSSSTSSSAPCFSSCLSFCVVAAVYTKYQPKLDGAVDALCLRGRRHEFLVVRLLLCGCHLFFCELWYSTEGWFLDVDRL